MVPSAKLTPEKASMATAPQLTSANLDKLRIHPSLSKFFNQSSSHRLTLLRPLEKADQEFFFSRIKAKPNKKPKIPTYIKRTSLVVVSGSSICGSSVNNNYK
jgi:hypothetical protein